MQLTKVHLLEESLFDLQTSEAVLRGNLIQDPA